MRKEVIGNCTLYQGDCFDVLSDISGVDCVVTDPPYGLTANSWDKAPDLAIFWKHLHEAAKLDAAFCVFCQMPFAADLYQANRKNFRYEYIYIKPKPVGWLNANRLPMRKHENIYIFYRSFPTYLPQKTSGTPYKKNQRRSFLQLSLRKRKRDKKP